MAEKTDKKGKDLNFLEMMNVTIIALVALVAVVSVVALVLNVRVPFTTAPVALTSAPQGTAQVATEQDQSLVGSAGTTSSCNPACITVQSTVAGAGVQTGLRILKGGVQTTDSTTKTYSNAPANTPLTYTVSPQTFYTITPATVTVGPYGSATANVQLTPNGYGTLQVVTSPSVPYYGVQLQVSSPVVKTYTFSTQSNGAVSYGNIYPSTLYVVSFPGRDGWLQANVVNPYTIAPGTSTLTVKLQPTCSNENSGSKAAGIMVGNTPSMNTCKAGTNNKLVKYSCSNAGQSTSFTNTTTTCPTGTACKAGTFGFYGQSYAYNYCG